LTAYWRGYFQSEAKYPWILKGGYAMELRIRAGRTTKDIDLTLYDGSRLSKDPGERRNQVRAMHLARTTVRGETARVFLATRRAVEYKNERPHRQSMQIPEARKGRRTMFLVNSSRRQRNGSPPLRR
jgi:hypothetical protein